MTRPPYPPRPRPRVGARSTAAFVLLTVTAATAVWTTVQVAYHSPRSGHGDLAPSSTQTTPATSAPAVPVPASAPPAAPPSAPVSAQPSPPNTAPAPNAEQHLIPPTPTRTTRARTPRPHAPRPHRTPARPSPHRPPNAKPRTPAQPQTPAWIHAECARRFPSGPRRAYCVTYLQQSLGR
ncbi:hypothetical protein SMC26_43890 [Actinomadura fulvescens]|uniref:hypothetical protein n=1 Tax=Actinomadura fulvescens TaxID=46160 RepID=UPI0031D0DD97